ncbi:MAG: HAD family hydrolase [Burkholderiales bacterium]
MHGPFELLVFDWDGTLMDSAAAIAESLQAACAELGLPVPGDAQARYVIGLGLTDAMKHILPDLPPAEYPQVVDRYRIHFLKRDGGTTLFRGAAEMIRELHDAGFQLAIATGKSRRGLDRALAATGIGGFFQATRCADEGFAKPHPDMLTAVIDTLAGEVETTVMIGDTTHDLEMANAAGVGGVAVTYGAHQRAALADCRPLAMIDDVRSLRDWLLSRHP